MKKQLLKTDNRLIILRRMTGKSRKELAQSHDLPEITLRQWETKQTLTIKGLERCHALYRDEGICVTKEWIASGKGTFPFHYRSLEPSFLNDPQNHLLCDQLAQVSCLPILREITFFKNINPTAFVIQVSDDAMRPHFVKGDYVGGMKHALDQSAEGMDAFNGMDAIVQCETGEIFFRRVFCAHPLGVFDLVALSPSNDNETLRNCTLLWVAPVVWHRRML